MPSSSAGAGGGGAGGSGSPGPPPAAVPPALRAAAAHVFVADLAAPELADEDRHHLERVLRIRPGEVVTVSDGAGSWRACAWAGGGALQPVGDVVSEPAPSPQVTVGFAPVKGERPEWAVQKLVEAGVDVVAPLLAARSVVRWDPDKASRTAERLARVAREAAMQSRRVWLPEVRPAAPFAEVAAAVGPPVALAELGGAPPALSCPSVLVGPEGGWSPEELALGLPAVGLGPTVLRAETAAVAVGVLLCALRARIVRSHDA